MEEASAHIQYIVNSGREVLGHLHTALRESKYDRVILPQSGDNGFEAWRALHERFRPQTSGGMLYELRTLLLDTNLYTGENFETSLHVWEKRLERFSASFKMPFPQQILFLLLVNGAPDELVQHVCLTVKVTDPEPFKKARELVVNYVRSKKSLNFNGSQPMEVDALQKKTDKTCHYCGRKGHLEADCRKKKKDKEAGTLQPSKSGSTSSKGSGKGSSKTCTYCKKRLVTQKTSASRSIQSSGSKRGLARARTSRPMRWRLWKLLQSKAVHQTSTIGLHPVSTLFKQDSTTPSLWCQAKALQRLHLQRALTYLQWDCNLES